MQFFHEYTLVFLYTAGNVCRRFDGLVLVECPCKGYFVADLGLAAVYPGIGVIGQDFASKIGVNVFQKRHIFRVAF